MSQLEFFDLEYLRQFEGVLVYHRKDGNLQKFEYKRIINEVEKLLKQFQDLYIPKTGGGFGLFLENHSSPAILVALLGILNYGCYVCPINSNENLDNYLQLCGANYIVSDQVINSSGLNNKVFQKLRIFNEEFILSSFADHNQVPKQNLRKWCYVIGTSGSTGKPKTVYVPYECIERNVLALSQRLKVTKNDVIFQCAPLTFDPFFVEFFLTLCNGASLLTIPNKIRLMPKQLLEALFPSEKLEVHVTIMQMTPSHFRIFGAENIKNVILNENSSLRILMLGGEDFPSINELRSWLPNGKDNLFFKKKQIFNIYGTTELSCWSSIYECNAETLEEYDRVPLGDVFDKETKLRIVSKDGIILCGETTGELEIGSVAGKCFIPHLDGQLNEWASQSDKLVYRKTGDLVDRDNKGNIYFNGRINNIIKRFGMRMCLDTITKDINAKLFKELPEAEVFCLWHKETEKLIFYLKILNDCVQNRRKCRRYLMENLEKHKKPDRIVFVDKFLLNSHGKLSHSNCLEQLKCSRNPVEIFIDFLSETLGFDFDDTEFEFELENTNPTTSKKMKLDTEKQLNCSFSAVGGTSFHALSLAFEIGKMFYKSTDEQILLELLLNESATISKIIKFLLNVELKTVEEMRIENVSNPNQLKNSKKIKLLWRVNLEKCVDASPATILNKYVCIGSHSHLLLTIDGVNGQEISRLVLPDRIECQVEYLNSTCLMKNAALVGCYDSNVYIFDYIRGVICWSLNVGGIVKAKPLQMKNTAIVGSYGEEFNLNCICLQTKSFIWRKKLAKKGIFASPISVGDASEVLICTLDGTYALIESTKGVIKWLHNLATPIFSTPVLLFNATQFINATVSGNVSICESLTGKQLHSFCANGNIFSSFATYDDGDDVLILFGCHDFNVYCLKYGQNNFANLNFLWKMNLNSAIYATPLLLRSQTDANTNFVFICTTKGRLVLLSLDKGEIIATHELKCEIFSTPYCLFEKNIYFGSRDNNLNCFCVE